MIETDLASRAQPAVWARAKITEISQRSLWDREINAAAEIRRIALDHCLMSAWTAFVAVDSSQRTEGEYGTTVPVAVPVPEGVRYDTTVLERGG